MDVSKSLNEIDTVGHRVVHGAKNSAAVYVSPMGWSVKLLNVLIWPHYITLNLTKIRAMDTIIPGIPQVAVFDTAFHQTMPD